MVAETHQERSSYSPEDLELVKSACLTVTSILGAYVEDICIVGGLVPALLIDLHQGASDDYGGHPGSNDLDIALSIALLDENRYEDIHKALVMADFRADVRPDTGNPVAHRWRLRELKVTIDWLIQATPAHPPSRTHHLSQDFGAVAMRGMSLALAERVDVQLAGTTLEGHRLERPVPVCGPAAFMVLKALAIAGRHKKKDAFDLVYVLRNYAGGVNAIVDALLVHADTEPEVVGDALAAVARDFSTIEHQGPQDVADFGGFSGEAHAQELADAHGYVAELLYECRGRGLI